MYLKRLDIQGFKSFVDKLYLEFNSGITSIVGPNGSGKSNIADAVRWVLGEQSAKTLRGSKMEDVIFAGTEHRKPVGFAEVSLTIDNSDGGLPVEYSEITVTRRIFRSGESEFFINKSPCRLKDIHGLFLDTGVGREGYSIIGQGRIDEILSTRSEDRRLIFEEASGIMKYKVRKAEAERKLEQTRQNLLRINDIIAELENQLEPLKSQAETAKRFLSLREGLKELEVNVYIENISRYREKLKEFEGQYKTLNDNLESENGRLEAMSENHRKKTEVLKVLDEKLESARQLFYSLEGTLEKCSSEIKLNEEKMNGLVQSNSRLDQEVEEIREKLQGLEGEEGTKRKKVEYLNRQHSDFLLKLEESQKKYDELLATLDESEKQIESLKTLIMDKLDVQSDKRTQLNNVKSHIEALNKRQASIEHEITLVVLEKDREGMKKEDLTESIKEARQNVKASREKLNGLKDDKAAMEQRLSELRKKQTAQNSELQFKSSRHKMLCDMEKNLEGYNRSVREVLNACRQSQVFGAGIYGALAQLIKVEKRHETAVEMALGSSLQNIVTGSEEDAKKAIEYLKEHKLGRATFLPVSSVKGRFIDSDTYTRLKSFKGFYAVASDLVEYDPRYKGVILSLLGRVVAAEDLEAGVGMARSFGHGFRIVTLDGDIINTSGSMTGGSIENRGPGILSRSREISDLKVELDRLSASAAELESEIRALVAGLAENAENIASTEKLLKDYELIMVRDESNLSQVEENIRKASARAEMLRQEKGQLSRQQTETEAEVQKYALELLDIENEIAEARKIVAEFQEKHKEDQTFRNLLHTEITDYRISVNSILESLQSVRESMERITGEKEGLEKGISRKINEKNKNCGELQKLKEKNEGVLLAIKRHEEERAGKTFEIDRLTEEKKVLEEELYELVTKTGDINKSILLLREELGRIEVKKAKLESEMEAIQNRMWEEYELTYTNALELRKDIGSVTQAQKRINELKNQVKELGPVNVGAIEEYIKTRERFEFMSAQRNDMEQAAEKLKRVIYEITSIMKRQFLEQFKLINGHFNTVFRELFDGGRAELKLSDEENVLESGIEIVVQPPGKRLQNMMLLSGGERAFTAIALLFAILRLRPTPFCILDEIEAALDDANVYRFSEYLKRYSDNTQFILVTHRKGTMEGSDTLYGVTMQERGISKIVSLKMGEVAV